MASTVLLLCYKCCKTVQTLFKYSSALTQYTLNNDLQKDESFDSGLELKATLQLL